MAPKLDKNLIGLTGEFYVLAQLTQRGYIATLTLSTTKSVDILVFSPEARRYWRVEVKTTSESLKPEKLFGSGRFYKWQLGKKAEEIRDPDLIYCFVCLGELNELPRIFVIPSETVGEYVKWQHQYWLDAPRKKTVKDSDMRKFRVHESDPDGYGENWSLFDRG